MSIARDHMYLQRAGRILQDLDKFRTRESVSVSGIRHRVTDDRIRNIREEDPTDNSVWHDFGENDRWGGYRSHAAFVAQVEVPESFRGLDAYIAVDTGLSEGWDATNPQFLVYVDGEARQALDKNHRSSRLMDEVFGGETFELYFSSYTAEIKEDQLFRLKLEARDPRVNQLYYDLKVAVEAASLMEMETESFLTIIHAVNDTINLLDLRQPFSPEFYESVDRALEFIDEELYTRASDEGKFPVVRAVGHTHIDVAWLWSIDVTRNKTVHSFTTVLELMERYPEYIFMSSQAQLYAFVKEDAPEVYERIKERVAEGRWETEGGMWVEADTNVSSGEALVRQFLYGKKFFREEFGHDHKILWLPDVFGYAASLPQIMKKSGIDYFMTTKISWNEYNQLPYDTFMWEGIDGSKVLTHFIPAQDYQPVHLRNREPVDFFTTYNGQLGASQVLGSWDRYQQKDLNQEVLMSYGHGDGGGGTTEEMVENQRRLARGLPGVPRTMPSTALDFYEKLEADVKDNPMLPHWSGELYFEYHRGVYTSQAETKRDNRRSEFALQNVEFLSQFSKVLLETTDYPREALWEHWHTVLTNQFHDILPGTSIKEVYEDTKRDYERVLAWTKQQLVSAGQSLADEVEGEAGELLVVNPTSYPFTGIVRLTEEQTQLAGLRDDVYQVDAEGRSLVYVEDVQPFGYELFTHDDLLNLQAKRRQTDSGLVVSRYGFENNLVSVTWNDEGEWTSFYDKVAQREVLPEGTLGHKLVAYEDKPHNYEAWDINIYYQEKSWPVHGLESLEVIADNELRVGVELVRRYLHTTIRERLYLERDSALVSMEFDIDWQETNQLLKLHFPYDIFTREATFDIQFGQITRPTHQNTSWDLARFEVAMQKWVSVHEQNFGISIINDSKYGASVKPGDIGLSLLKAPRYPSEVADIGRQQFRYGIMPYTGTLADSATFSEAYQLNNPPQVYVKNTGGGTLSRSQALVYSPNPALTIEAVKAAESGEGMIVRVYENRGARHQDASLVFARPVYEAREVNLLEDIVEGAETTLSEDGRQTHFRIEPFEIKSFHVMFE